MHCMQVYDAVLVAQNVAPAVVAQMLKVCQRLVQQTPQRSSLRKLKQEVQTLRLVARLYQVVLPESPSLEISGALY